MVEYVAREMSRHRSRNRRRMLHLPRAICPDRSPPMNVTPSPQRCCQQRACSAARETGGRPSRAYRGARARLCAGQSRHPSCPAGERFFAVLPAQSEALSTDRHLGPGRSARAGTRRGPRHSHLPRYGVWRNGDLVAEDVRDLWRDDLVSFVIGCSFSFEEALMAEGIELRHIARTATCRCTVPRPPPMRQARSMGRRWYRCGR